MSAHRPRIGLTTYFVEAAFGVWSTPAAVVPHAYLRSVTRAGGTPLLLPPLVDDTVVPDAPLVDTPLLDTSVLAVLDGLVVLGGPDVDPATYDAPRHPATVSDRVRDDHETALINAALERRTPLLAVCRGAQVLNVALGGTLLQHLPDTLGHSDYQPAPGEFGEVEVTCEAGSRIHRALGESSTQACYHHQAIDRVGEGLVVTARSADRLVQAVETTTPGWALGVQFHPEERQSDLRLFSALVEEADRPRGAP
ncbi:gamma-glutamyl-gamma-aminobutyrate hydrolase family protein [Aeromicrobium sp. CF4.19]|uniref:gamma-glutamyl-gamma-aminobutyrate hydrolase family protein n=1 Tax=Aeromicrobium sp. CF4.19 TaxID=3373082 RepID=UPI003EE56C82